MSIGLIVIIILSLICYNISGDKCETKPLQNPEYFENAVTAMENEFYSNSLDYVNTVLKKVPNHVASLALKIKLLLLIGGSENRNKAKKFAEQKYCSSQALDRWIKCLKDEKVFDELMVTKTEFENKCPWSAR